MASARRSAVNRGNIEEGAELLALSLHSRVSRQDIAGLQPESADLCRRHIDIVLTRKIIVASG